MKNLSEQIFRKSGALTHVDRFRRLQIGKREFSIDRKIFIEDKLLNEYSIVEVMAYSLDCKDWTYNYNY